MEMECVLAETVFATPSMHLMIVQRSGQTFALRHSLELTVRVSCAPTIAPTMEFALMVNASAVLEQESIARNHFALVNHLAQLMGDVLVLLANAIRDGQDQTAQLKDARWFPTAQVTVIASRELAIAKRDGKEMCVKLKPSALMIATTADCASEENATAEVAMVVLPVNVKSAHSTAQDMEFVFAQRRRRQERQCNARASRDGMDTIAQCLTVPMSVPTTASVIMELASATTSGRVRTALCMLSHARTTAPEMEFAHKN